METVAGGADPSQAGEMITGGEGGPVQPSQPFSEKTRDFGTPDLLPNPVIALEPKGVGFKLRAG